MNYMNTEKLRIYYENEEFALNSATLSADGSLLLINDEFLRKLRETFAEIDLHVVAVTKIDEIESDILN